MNSQVKLSMCSGCGQKMVGQKARARYPELRVYKLAGGLGLCKACYQRGARTKALAVADGEKMADEGIIQGLLKDLKEDWRYYAACRDEDPDLFFPVGNSIPALLQVAEAKSVCHRCPVASQCLEWAVGHKQEVGVWGAMSESERRAMKRGSAPRTPRELSAAQIAAQQRQSRAMELSGQGKTNVEVARILKVSEDTVCRYLAAARKAERRAIRRMAAAS